MQDQKVTAAAGHNGIPTAIVATEVNKHRAIVEQLDNGPYLAARKPRRREVSQKGHYIKYGGQGRFRWLSWFYFDDCSTLRLLDSKDNGSQHLRSSTSHSATSGCKASDLATGI